MNRYTLVTLAFLLFGLSAHPLADAQSDAQAQVKFGNEVARLGLWKEAIYRFQRAVDVDPTYAPAWNNLGIGYEHEGRMEEAREAYETALDLDPSNLTIETNYDLFLEVSDRVTEDSR
jgi:Flp pilus assembly protein TadD